MKYDLKRTFQQQQKYNKIQQEKDRELMSRLKINGCAICGYNTCSKALDFHHVNPQDKIFTLKTCELHRSSESIINELIKCILLCKNCHTEVEYANKK